MNDNEDSVADSNETADSKDISDLQERARFISLVDKTKTISKMSKSARNEVMRKTPTIDEAVEDDDEASPEEVMNSVKQIVTKYNKVLENVKEAKLQAIQNAKAAKAAKVLEQEQAEAEEQDRINNMEDEGNAETEMAESGGEPGDIGTADDIVGEDLGTAGKVTGVTNDVKTAIGVEADQVGSTTAEIAATDEATTPAEALFDTGLVIRDSIGTFTLSDE